MTDPVRCGLVKAVCVGNGTFEWVTPECKESYENGLGQEAMSKDMAVKALTEPLPAAGAATHSAHPRRIQPTSSKRTSLCSSCMII